MNKTRFLLRHTLSSLCGALALVLLLAGCGGSNTPAPSTQQLIKDAQTAIQKVTSYHFNLAAQNIGASSALPIQGADGDIIVPDRLQANANVLFGGAVVQAQIITIGADEYLNVLGGWQKTSGLLDPRVLSDTKTGVAAILGQIQNPSTASDSSSNNTPCWSISGKLSASYLTGITGGGAPAGTMDDVTTCIGKSDSLPYLIVIKGIAAQGDTTSTTRTFKLSKFNEQISITAPQINTTPAATATP